MENKQKWFLCPSCSEMIPQVSPKHHSAKCTCTGINSPTQCKLFDSKVEALKFKNKDLKRGFYWPKKAWYSNKDIENSIHFGIYADEGGTTSEINMTLIELGGKMVPQLRVFDDAWEVLSTFDDLIGEISEFDNKNITQEKFVEILKDCGFKDNTPYNNPYDKDDQKTATDLMTELSNIDRRKKEIEKKLVQLKNKR